MGPELISLIERIAMKMQSIMAKQPYYIEGLSPVQASARLRTQIKDRMAAAMVGGWGKQLYCAGFSAYGTASHI